MSEKLSERHKDLGVFDEFMGIDPDDRDLDKVESANASFVPGFEKSLKDAGLSDRTIRKHVNNIDFFMSQLAYTSGLTMLEGADLCVLDDIIGYYFVYKNLSASQTSLKEYASSVKKFYKYAFDKGYITKEDWDDVKESIKKDLPHWLNELKAFDSGMSMWDIMELKLEGKI